MMMYPNEKVCYSDAMHDNVCLCVCVCVCVCVCIMKSYIFAIGQCK